MALYSSFTFAGDWILFTISRVCRLTFLTALSFMCDSTAYFAVPLLLTPFLTALNLKPRKSEYCLFKLTILDFSGLMVAGEQKRGINNDIVNQIAVAIKEINELGVEAVSYTHLTILIYSFKLFLVSCDYSNTLLYEYRCEIWT